MDILGQLVNNYAQGLQQNNALNAKRLDQPTAVDVFLDRMRQSRQDALQRQQMENQAAYRRDQLEGQRQKSLMDFLASNKAGMIPEEQAGPALRAVAPWLNPDQVNNLTGSFGNKLSQNQEMQDKRLELIDYKIKKGMDLLPEEIAYKQAQTRGLNAGTELKGEQTRLAGSKANISEIDEKTREELNRSIINRNNRPPAPPAAFRMASMSFKSLPPGAQAMIEQLGNAVLNGDMAGLQNARTSPYASQIFEYVTSRNPNFQYDPNAVANKAAEQKYWTGNGVGAKQVADTNTAAHHLAYLAQLAKGLDNGDTRAINAIRQEYARQTGSPAPTNMDFATQFIGNEVMKASKGPGVLTNQEQEHFDKNVSTSASPQQLLGHIQTALQLMGGRLASNEQRYQSAYGQSISSRLTPQAKQAFSAVGVDFHSPEDLGNMPFGSEPKFTPQAQPQSPARPAGQQLQTTIKDGKTYYKWSDGKWHTRKPEGM